MTTTTTDSTIANPGLDGVIAAETSLSSVDGEAGELIVAGYPIEEIATRSSFEEMLFALWYGSLPDRSELTAFRSDLAGRRPIAPLAIELVRAASASEPMDALRFVAGTLSLHGPRDDDSSARDLVSAFPTIVATWWRLRQGLDPVEPRSDLGHAENFLFMLTGEIPDPERTRGLDTYLNTVIDHGLNASTFTARVIASTGSDLFSAVAGALGALKGPLHGGAPGPALDLVFEIGSSERAEQVLRSKIAAGERLMGFGHRVYRVRDPRADVLAAAAERLFRSGGDIRLYNLARSVEATALRVLEEHKPGRRLQTNVEFYTALLLHGLGLQPALFTPVFAMSRVGGWAAHCFEQRQCARIMRPQSLYRGARDRKWAEIGDRRQAGD